MFRYVAFIWNDADAEAQRHARMLAERLQSRGEVWQPALRVRGLEVFCRDLGTSSGAPHRLHGDAGVVLGTLFLRDGGGCSHRAPLALDESESARILETRGRRLVEHYWGRYVAFLTDADGSALVLRDPTASLPCFTMRTHGVDIFFAHMEEGAALGDGGFSVNWKYVAAALCQNRLQTYATGLNEVTQVLGGECLRMHRGEVTRQFYWNAVEVAASAAVEDPREATRRLRACTLDCVHAWASTHSSIVLLLSGGLDSSIVAASLGKSLGSGTTRVTCLNLHSPGSNTDERGYARVVAASAGLELVERPRDSTVSLERLLAVRRSCIPGDNFFYLGGGRIEAEVAAERQATAVFSGYGGDQLFYQARARYAAGDYLARHPIGPALFTVALDAARVDRLSVWHVLGEALAHRLLGRRWRPRDGVGEHRPLLRPEVIDDIRRDASLVHPWLRAPGGLPSGKLWHVHQLLFPDEPYHPLGRDTDPEPVTPLFSQPLLELVLRVPTWVLTIGGWDRALARRAFQHELPRSIVTRRTKGGQEEYAKAILVRQLAFARELLIGGGLVREGILDARRVSEVLSGKPTRTPTSNVELYACLSVEAWLRQWDAT